MSYAPPTPIKWKTVQVTRHVTLEGSGGIHDEEPSVVLNIKVSLMHPDYGCFELWDDLTGGNKWYAEGGLWLEHTTGGMALSDYDGVAGIDEALPDILEGWGINVKDFRE